MATAEAEAAVVRAAAVVSAAAEETAAHQCWQRKALHVQQQWMFRSTVNP